jgi:gamma-glutamylcyclotransferase (GGCT)/AIG2-like uncharacterized protein YtfP
MRPSPVPPGPPPPPPPPPPCPTPTRPFKLVGQMSAPWSVPDGTFVQSVHKEAFSQCSKNTRADTPEELFQPCHMFFYGSLMDPEVLQAILDVPDIPTTRSATILGFQIKMWGIYPALVPSSSSRKVIGCVWEVLSENHFQRLAAYETAAYRWQECEAILEDGIVLDKCRTFCWAGEPDSKELEDGSFDLDRYQKYFKSSVTRRRSPAF